MKRVFYILATLFIVAQAAWADQTVTMEDGLRYAVTSNQTVTLGADITLNNGRLNIDGKTVTLDLNGHTLTRPMTAVDAGGQVIMVMNGGHLTITDTSGNNSGTITGGWAYQGGGIFVRAASLTIEGGTITGNRASKDAGGGYGYGGGVEIENGSTMTMTGGSITGNTAEGYGGGIYLDGIESNQESVRLTMTGGSINGNTAGIAGGGIYQWYCTVNMQGSPVVENNISDDYFLSNWGLITVTGAFTSGASIGVSTEWDKDYFTSSYSTHNPGVNPSTYFHVGSNRVTGTIGWNTGNTEAKLTQTGYKYIERAWDSTSKTVTETTKTCTSYTAINGNNTSDEGGWVGLYNGWYVVTGNSSYKVLNVLGNNVNLIIPDGVTLNVVGGVKVELKNNAVLNIYGQAGNTGQLIATNSYSGAAGIGSGGSSDDGNAGMINIHGGTIDATGNQYGAGIGGGDNHGFGPQANNSGLYIYGGHVTAQGGEYAAGIGSGDEPNDGTAGYVVVYGGTVNATGGNEAAGIGGGNEGHGAMFSIYGGTVTATGGSRGAGIGGGDEGNSSTTTFYGGTVTAQGGNYGAGIGGGWGGYASAIEVHGGNITAIGGAKTGLNTGGGAGIGGGYKGDCRGIYFRNSSQSVTGQPATVNATAGKVTESASSTGLINGAAGIGSGENSDNCTLTIEGGNITATAQGNGPGIGRGYTTGNNSSKQVNVNITGGDVTATSANGGAGIGTGAATYFYGRIYISGGTVQATGKKGGAGIGIGGPDSGDYTPSMYGWIVISGGEVIAKGEGIGDDGITTSGAGIGSGATGTILGEALIQILGGTITASSENGGAIGAGGTKLSTATTYSVAKGPIQIHGDNTTLFLTSGKIKKRDAGTVVEESSPAIRINADLGGSLSINGHLAVTKGGTTSAEADRVSTLTTATDVQVTVTPCTHGNCTYTINGSESHTAHCTYCGHEATDSHQSGTCVCGYQPEVTTYKVTLYTYNASGNNYSSTEEEVVTGQVYTVPNCTTVPQGWEFVGWVDNSNPVLTSFEKQTGEVLIQPGSQRTVATTFVARYQKIELSLADAAEGNMTILSNYNGILTTSVTLTGRTFWKDGSWNTLCLPFAVSDFTGTPLEGATVKTLESSTFGSDNSTLTLNFTEDANNLTSIEAGKPYIVKWTRPSSYVAYNGTNADACSDIVNPVFNGVTISNTTTDAETTAVTFHGIYSPYAVSGEDNTMLYLAADNTLYYPNDAMTIGAFRAYFQLANGITAGSAGDLARIVLSFGDDESTQGVTTPLSTARGTGGEAWYAIDGRRLNGKPSASGLYIHNGRKVIIK